MCGWYPVPVYLYINTEMQNETTEKINTLVMPKRTGENIGRVPCFFLSYNLAPPPPPCQLAWPGIMLVHSFNVAGAPATLKEFSI